jgi:DNA-binding transcriptional regulator YiaG
MNTPTKASRRSSKTTARRIIKKDVSSPFEVKRFCSRYKIIRPDLTRLTGYSLRSVDKWASGEQPSAAARKQLAELVRLFDALTEIMETDYIGEWLKENPLVIVLSTPTCSSKK